MNDIKFALRQLFKNPGFSAVAILTLGLGIGANTTVFCWVQNVLLRPLPGVAQAERMVVLTTMTGSAQHDGVSLPDLKDYAGLKDVFSGVIGSQFTPANIGINGRNEWVYGQITTANYFDVLGIKPLAGRFFLPDEDTKPGGNPVMVLSEGFWKRRFASDPKAIGSTIEINKRPFTIVGVAPREFRGTMSGLGFEFWAPISMHKEVANFGSLTSRSDHWLHTQARLQPGMTIDQARSAVEQLGAVLEQTYPGENHETRARVLTLLNSPYGGPSVFRPLLIMLSVVSITVLLIVAANIANLLLARATTREKEIAIRLAVGASRGRLIRQLLTESVLLSLLGGALGAILSKGGAKVILAMLPSTPLPLAYTFEVDLQTLFFTTLVAVATGIVFGLAPAWHSARANLNDTLRLSGRVTSAGSGRLRLRNSLVCTEIALALMLLVCAGLCLRGFQQSRQIDPGFHAHNVLLGGMRLGAHGYTEQTGKSFYRRLLAELREQPGVVNAALASWIPLGLEGGSSAGVTVEGYVPTPNENMSVKFSIVSPGYFETMGIPLPEGRDFAEQDDERNTDAMIVNEVMARRFWPGQNPVGRKIRALGREHVVIGVAKSGKYRSLGEAPEPFFYRTYSQGSWDLNLTAIAKTAGAPVSMIGTLRRSIQKVDPAVELWATMPLEEYIQAAYTTPRIAATLLLTLGALALLLAAMGLYAVLSYLVSTRRQEIGIRMALGAQQTDVLGLVVGQGMRLTSVGVVVGLAGSMALGRLLNRFLYGVSPFDPLVYGSVALLLALVALMACLLPANKAVRVNPLTAIRDER